MTHILCIETGTTVCSVALGNENGLLGYKELADSRSHASELSVFIQDLLKELSFNIKDIDAIAVSKGPGSYTGLRIGVSLAKGICFALNKPLIAIGSLDSMVYGIDYLITQQKLDSSHIFCPMIDARRMEVYSALFDYNKNRITDVSAIVVDADTYSEHLKTKKIVFFGNGASKCKSVISNQNAIFIHNFEPSARFMLPLALNAYKDDKFEDIAYFEPFYLKDFVAIKAKNKFLPENH